LEYGIVWHEQYEVFEISSEIIQFLSLV